VARRRRASLLVLLLITGLFPLGVSSLAAALPDGFQDIVVLDGLSFPTAVEFSPDGRIFVAEQEGIVKVFDGFDDAQPEVFADLRADVSFFGDRGLLGLALHPDFPEVPYLYALYTHDAPLPGTLDKTWKDDCQGIINLTLENCVASARLSRLTASGNQMSDIETLIWDWCVQFQSHSVGTVLFGPDGKLYVGGGEGARPGIAADWGQYPDPDDDRVNPATDPHNPCDDPPGGVGGVMEPPTAEGGALRSQDLRTPGTTGDPTGLDGTIIRVDPTTGEGPADNPLSASGDENERRIVAYGLRNPFRFTFRPGTSEIWIGDVGRNLWEEIDLIENPTDPLVENFGWPCYEGEGRLALYDTENLNLCEELYAEGSVTNPVFQYQVEKGEVVQGDGCATGGAAISGIAFYQGGSYPDQFDGALFFTDYVRQCMWVVHPGADGRPDFSTIELFSALDLAGEFDGPVDLTVGPGGDLFYLGIEFDSEDGTPNGKLHRIQFFTGNQPPTALIEADPTSGAEVPLEVTFDGSGSSDPEGGQLTYEWDFGDGATDSGATVIHSYEANGLYQATLTVTDPLGASATADITIAVGNSAPVVSIDTIDPSQWAVGDEIRLVGSATDDEDGSLSGESLEWLVDLLHCREAEGAESCHRHFHQSFTGSEGTVGAPDHGFPSHLEVTLTATDDGIPGTDGEGRLSSSVTVEIDPLTADLTFETDPSGLQLTVALPDEDPVTRAAPFTERVIVGSTVNVGAPSPQVLDGTSYQFVSWSDGGAQSHDIVAPDANAAYLAQFQSGNRPPVAHIEASPTTGLAPLTVQLDGSGSSDPEGGALKFAWDLDGDGNFDDFGGVQLSLTFSSSGTFQIGLQVSDPLGASDNALVEITVGGVLAGGLFVDIGGSVFLEDIIWLAEQGITKGCNPPANDRFCPDDFVSRGQMAAFLVRALNLPASSQDFFADDEGSIFEGDINSLAAAGITRGCDASRFCPDDFVSRGQMAAFLHRAFG
jgi:glucose/arabinose dehydrogenase/PKD repeat protein